jgi:hypothetical protein
MKLIRAIRQIPKLSQSEAIRLAHRLVEFETDLLGLPSSAWDLQKSRLFRARRRVDLPSRADAIWVWRLVVRSSGKWELSKVDTIPPAVVIVRPDEGKVVRRTERIEVRAVEDVSTSPALRLKIGTAEVVLGEGGVYDWDTTSTRNGQYVLTVSAVDASGNEGVAVPVRVKVDNREAALAVSAGTLPKSVNSGGCRGGEVIDRNDGDRPAGGYDVRVTWVPGDALRGGSPIVRGGR